MKDCVIVCGYPTQDDGKISHILESRIAKAVELYQNHEVKYIIVSGGAIHNAYSESLVMQEYALTNGVPQQHILLENRAKSTYHNMKYSKEIMQQYGLKTCFIVTNSWHIIKAKYYAKKFALNYTIIKANKPHHMSYLKVIILHMGMPINMFVNRLKGYK